MSLLNKSMRKWVRTGCLVGWGVIAFLLLFAGSTLPQNYSGLSNQLFAQNNQGGGNQGGGNQGGNRGGNQGGNNQGNNQNIDDASYMRWGYRSLVGGFSIDANSALRPANTLELTDLATSVKAQMQSIPAELDKASPERKISLRRLNDLLAQCSQNNTVIPDSARYLGGLTAIHYVIAVPEDKDIYLVGPAESWITDSVGNVVGKDSGKPILLLEDFLTVLRAWNTNNPELISCSIDPTQEALQQFAQMPKIQDPLQKKLVNEQAMGMMEVSFGGISRESRMAHVLAAADYSMKRLSLGFELSPVKGLGSYTETIRRGGAAYAPRFWIEPNYSTLYHDQDKLVWNLSETKVNTLTEREYFDAYGNRKVSAKNDSAAQKWAGNMTKHYNELAKAVPVFAEARNCMDLALVVAVLYSQNLPQKANFAMGVLTDQQTLGTPKYPAVTKVNSESLVRVTSQQGDYISVTGGVLINPWEVVRNNTTLNADLAKFTTPAHFELSSWWSN